MSRTCLKHIADDNLPSSYNQLTMLTSNIEGYRLSMIIDKYGEKWLKLPYIFSLSGPQGSPPPPLDTSLSIVLCMQIYHTVFIVFQQYPDK